MHELGIISTIVKTVVDVMVREQLAGVEKIVLQVGELSGVVPHYVEECYHAAVYKTPLENTELEMEVIPCEVLCRTCGETFNAASVTFDVLNAARRTWRHSAEDN